MLKKLTKEAQTNCGDQGYADTSFAESAVGSDDLLQRTIQIKRARNDARKGQLVQAECMVKRSKVDLKKGEEGDNVAIPIPMVDRGRGDPRNILGVILNRNIDNEMYTIGVKAGVLKGCYSRNQFDVCPQRLLSISNINTRDYFSLRAAVKAQSMSGGQGYVKCSCSLGKKQCQTNKCKCFKAKVACNSRCHNSLSCKNK